MLQKKIDVPFIHIQAIWNVQSHSVIFIKIFVSPLLANGVSRYFYLVSILTNLGCFRVQQDRMNPVYVFESPKLYEYLPKTSIFLIYSLVSRRFWHFLQRNFDVLFHWIFYFGNYQQNPSGHRDHFSADFHFVC